MRSDEHWPQTDRVWRQFAQLDIVLGLLDIDPVHAARKAGGSAMAKARDTCLACVQQRECRLWLEGGGDVRAILDFCPNAPFLAECIRPNG